MDDESYGLDDESHGMDDKIRSLDDKGHSVKSDGIGLEEVEEAIPGEEDQVYSTFEVGQGSGSAPESERPETVSASRQPTLPTWTDLEDATPAITETKGFLTELGAQVKMQGELIHDYAVRLEELSPALFERSLEYEQERVAVTFEAIWRPVLALESWAGQTDTQRLAEVVDGVRRGKEPKGDA
ncbi:hypothetical protein Tco_1458812 [Tanacetum coccineum]